MSGWNCLPFVSLFLVRYSAEKPQVALAPSDNFSLNKHQAHLLFDDSRWGSSPKSLDLQLALCCSCQIVIISRLSNIKLAFCLSIHELILCRKASSKNCHQVIISHLSTIKLAFCLLFWDWILCLRALCCSCHKVIIFHIKLISLFFYSKSDSLPKSFVLQSA